MLVTIATFHTSSEAHLWKELLEKEKIPCFLFDDAMSVNYSLAIGGIKLKVLEDYAEQARELLKNSAGTTL